MTATEAYNRRLLDAYDFQVAKQYAERLIEELEKLTTPGVNPDAVVARGLWVALAMSYARPFKRSANPIKGLEPWDYADELRAQLPDDFIPIHERIVNEYRDKVFAHSDTSVRDIKRDDMGKPFGPVITYLDPYPPPPLYEVKWLLEVIEPLREYADTRRQELEPDSDL